jgi:hypothetical protein
MLAPEVLMNDLTEITRWRGRRPFTAAPSRRRLLPRAGRTAPAYGAVRDAFVRFGDAVAGPTPHLRARVVRTSPIEDARGYAERRA